MDLTWTRKNQIDDQFSDCELELQPGESEQKLGRILDETVAECRRQDAATVLFLDHVEALCPKPRGHGHGDRVSVAVATLFDGLERRAPLVVVGATSWPDDVDPALRRPGRFDREVSRCRPLSSPSPPMIPFHIARRMLFQQTDSRGDSSKLQGRNVPIGKLVFGYVIVADDEILFTKRNETNNFSLHARSTW